MIIFERHPKSYALQIRMGTSKTETLLLCFPPYRIFEIGKEPYSICICPHHRENQFRIEGLRNNTDIEIWFVGNLDVCIEKFEEITREIKSRKKLCKLNDIPHLNIPNAIKNRWNNFWN